MIPDCAFSCDLDGYVSLRRHRPAPLMISATAVRLKTPFTVRVCQWCLSDVVEEMRYSGDYTNIRVTAPEAPQPEAWK